MSAGTITDRPPLRNRFLAALPAESERRCLDAGTSLTFAAGDVVAHRGDPAAFVHFPLLGAISEIEEGLDGGSVEVTAIGFEGVSGIEALLDAPTESFLRIIQVPTVAIRVPVSALLSLRDADPALHAMIRRYGAARLRAAGITIGCNARHPLHGRLARWLLRMSDRMGHGDFELTHETISLMLGVRRASVTRAIAELCEETAIESARNSVRIVSRPVLERLTCSCYPESRDLYNEVFGDGDAAIEI